MKIYLCRYRNFAAVIAAEGIGECRTVVIETIGASWSKGADDRKQISCRETKGVVLDGSATSSATSGPILLQYSVG